MESSESLLDCALSYARAGYSVMPLHSIHGEQCSCGKADCRSHGKHPRIAHGSHAATTDEAAIRAWWTRWPDANIGMTLDNMVVVDIDPRNGGSISALPEFPGTCIAKTGGGGWHYLFRAEPGAMYPGHYCQGTDIKTGGGAYIVVAPSLHASGARYEWLHELSPAAMPPSPAPDWLASLAIVPKPRNITRTNIVTPKAPEPELPGWTRITPTLSVKTFDVQDAALEAFQ